MKEAGCMMKLELTVEQAGSLRDFLERCGDAERLSEREYVVDLYDISRPVSLDLVFEGGKVVVDGAAELLYDEAQDGWYMGRRLEQAGEVAAALEEAGAFGHARAR